jgi:surface carbohydrate biosynthesis protein
MSQFTDPSIENMMKTLILPAEIHAREFDARLLQGIVALRRGWKVIVGSKALINRAIWRMPRGLYLCQTVTHKRVTLLKLLRKLGFVAFGWDEEGLIYLNRDIYLMRRVSVETLSLLQSVITWGPQGAEDVTHRAKLLGLTPLPLGNPRFDFLRNELRDLYADDVGAIRAKYGHFVLINTNFSSFNPIISIHDLKARSTSDKHPPTESENARFVNLLAHRKEIYVRFLADLPRFASLHPQMQFVLRAHPAENEDTWRDAFKHQPNVSVVREGSSVPWLIASDALVHNSCTTAVEAAIIGLTPICYCPVISLYDESALPNPVSHRVYDFEQMAQALKLSANGALPFNKKQKKVLDLHVSAISGPLSCELIMDHLDGIDLPAVNPVVRAASMAFAYAREIFKSNRRGYITDRYLEKVFPALSRENVETRANQIASVLKVKGKVVVKTVIENVFELTLVE